MKGRDHAEQIKTGDHCMSVVDMVVHLVLDVQARGRGRWLKLACRNGVPSSTMIPSTAEVNCPRCRAAPPREHPGIIPEPVVATPSPQKESKPQEPDHTCRLCLSPLTQVKWNTKVDILTCLNPHCALAHRPVGCVRKEPAWIVSQGMRQDEGCPPAARENEPDRERDLGRQGPRLSKGSGVQASQPDARPPLQRRAVTRGTVKGGAKAGKAGTLHPTPTEE